MSGAIIICWEAGGVYNIIISAKFTCLIQRSNIWLTFINMHLIKQKITYYCPICENTSVLSAFVHMVLFDVKPHKTYSILNIYYSHVNFVVLEYE
jgi:hypothetical protein